MRYGSSRPILDIQFRNLPEVFQIATEQHRHALALRANAPHTLLSGSVEERKTLAAKLEPREVRAK